jgi:exosortase A-associated hydrolase 2
MGIRLHIDGPDEYTGPFYFGLSTTPLFGVYHAPQHGRNRNCGVVLCYPWGHEYTRAHRAYRQLAHHLSHIGFPVLRFDFYGCGDSDGDCEQGEMRQWLEDIEAAIREIRGKSGIGQVCLVGLRLGGTLAAMAGAARGDLDGLVLWDPVINGRTYLEELRALHQERLRVVFQDEPQDVHRAEKPTEIIGFPLTPALLTALEHLDLLAMQQKPAQNILIIASHEGSCAGQLTEHLKSLGARLAYQHLASPQIWRGETHTGLVPHQLLQSIVAWLAEVYS